MDLAGLQGQLQVNLFRLLCPQPEVLGEYFLGMLDPELHQSIDEHLKDCSHCTSELKSLRAYLRLLEPDIETSRTDQIKIWLAEKVDLISDALTFQTEFEPALLTLRGSYTETNIYKAGDYHLALLPKDDPANASKRTLIGAVEGLQESDCEAVLLKDEAMAWYGSLDDTNSFHAPALDSGRYTLIIACERFQIHVIGIEI
jgi:hypothetical protein